MFVYNTVLFFQTDKDRPECIAVRIEQVT